MPPKSPETVGRNIRLPKSRRLVVDLLKYSRRVPSQALTRYCNVKEVAALRSQVDPKVSWPALFIKAYALMSARRPQLRRLYMKWPWGYFYEHPYTIGRMTVSRQIDGEDWVLFARFVKPEIVPLARLHDLVAETRDLPVEQVERFRQQIAFAGVPTFLRRIAWWVSMNVSGYMRATRFGTFGLTTVSSLGAISIHPPCTGATTFTLGPVAKDGTVRVTMVYDHRMLDGAPVANYLRELEETLNTEILAELKAMQATGSTTRPAEATPSA
ncbi:MAG: hypothetical protein AB7O26_08820 [Planctomycetaceae bacterium]